MTSLHQRFELERAKRAEGAAEALKYLMKFNIEAQTAFEGWAEAIQFLRGAVIGLGLGLTGIPIEALGVRDMVELLKREVLSLREKSGISQEMEEIGGSNG